MRADMVVILGGGEKSVCWNEVQALNTACPGAPRSGPIGRGRRQPGVLRHV